MAPNPTANWLAAPVGLAVAALAAEDAEELALEALEEAAEDALDALSEREVVVAPLEVTVVVALEPLAVAVPLLAVEVQVAEAGCGEIQGASVTRSYNIIVEPLPEHG
jgi:hypothetical protein